MSVLGNDREYLYVSIMYLVKTKQFIANMRNVNHNFDRKEIHNRCKNESQFIEKIMLP